MVSLKDIDEFLYIFKRQKEKHGLIFLDREKNLQALLDLEISAKRRERIIMGLKAVDYYKGPRSDVLRPQFELWEFGKMIKNKVIYIKLALVEGKYPVCCYSFHPAERKIELPYQKNSL